MIRQNSNSKILLLKNLRRCISKNNRHYATCYYNHKLKTSTSNANYGSNQSDQNNNSSDSKKFDINFIHDSVNRAVATKNVDLEDDKDKDKDKEEDTLGWCQLVKYIIFVFDLPLTHLSVTLFSASASLLF